MAITFPLAPAAFADLLPVAEFRWRLDEFIEASGTGLSEVITNEIAPRKWRAEVQLARMSHARANDLQALFEAVGPAGTFYLYNRIAAFPRSDPGGAVAGYAVSLHTLGADNKSLRLTGLPAGYVLSRGDMLAFSYGASPTRRALHRVVETVTASGAGLSPLFEVRPFLKAGYALGAAVTLVRPAGKMMILPGTFEAGSAGPLIASGMGFTAVEVR